MNDPRTEHHTVALRNDEPLQEPEDGQFADESDFDVRAAADLLAKDWGVDADLWGCPSFTELAALGGTPFSPKYGTKPNDTAQG